MGIYTDRILPKLTDVVLGSDRVTAYRRRVVAGLAGEVLEVGFGSGLNVPVYPAEVTHVHAVDPATYGRRLAAERLDASPVEVEFVGVDGARIPLPDCVADAALSTFTLCTIPDVQAALAEIRRILKPGGRLHFIEHGLAPDPGVARWQHRLEPIQKRLAGGCHLTRDTTALIRSAGFEIVEMTNEYGEGPKPFSYFAIGVAVGHDSSG